MAAASYEYDIVPDAKSLKDDDMVIASMGPTGSGKSNFLDKLIGGKANFAVASLESQSSDVVAVRVKKHPLYKDSIVILDTPGFDNVLKSDLEILEMVSQWLLDVHHMKIRIKGILYFHRITDTRVSGAPNRNMRLMGDLCGTKGAAGAVLVTTMWDQLRSDDIGIRREQDLIKNFWRDMVSNGSTVDRFFNDQKSSWDIVGKLALKDTSEVLLLLQEEIAVLNRALEETRAGQNLLAQFHRLRGTQKRQLSILESLAKSNGHNPPPDFAIRHAALSTQIKETTAIIEKLQVPLGRKIRLLFQRNPTGRAIVIGDSQP